VISAFIWDLTQRIMGIPFWRFRTLEDGMDRLSRNVGMELSFYAAYRTCIAAEAWNHAQEYACGLWFKWQSCQYFSLHSVGGQTSGGSWKECDSKLSPSEVGILLEGLTETTTHVGHNSWHPGRGTKWDSPEYCPGSATCTSASCRTARR